MHILVDDFECLFDELYFRASNVGSGMLKNLNVVLIVILVVQMVDDTLKLVP